MLRLLPLWRPAVAEAVVEVDVIKGDVDEAQDEVQAMQELPTAGGAPAVGAAMTHMQA